MGTGDGLWAGGQGWGQWTGSGDGDGTVDRFWARDRDGDSGWVLGRATGMGTVDGFWAWGQGWDIGWVLGRATRMGAVDRDWGGSTTSAVFPFEGPLDFGVSQLFRLPRVSSTECSLFAH